MKDIIVITGPEFCGNFMQFLGSGTRFQCRFTYRIQDEPKGIAQALGMAESFANGEPVCALLGDNVFEDSLASHIHQYSGKGGHLFLKNVPDPERFGVVELKGEKVVSLEEKPKRPKTNLAVTGCYLYDARCFDIIRGLMPSARGELEITDVSKLYLQWGELTATVLSGDWVDAGTHEALRRAEAVALRRAM